MAHRINKHTEQSDLTQEKVVQAGVDLFVEELHPADPFRNMNLTDVATRAGLTRNGLLYHWPTKKEFCDEVASRLLSEVDHDLEFAQLTAAATAATSGDFADDLLRVAALDLALLADNNTWQAIEVVTIVYAAKRPELAEAARSGYRQVDITTWADVYGIIADRAGREPRTPFDGGSIGAVLQAFVEGAGIRQLFDPEVFGNPLGSGEHGTFALGVATLLSVMTRPKDGSDDRSVEAVLRDLVDHDAKGAA